MRKMPDKPTKVVALRRPSPFEKIRNDLFALEDAAEMLAFIQREIPRAVEVLRTTTIKCDLSYDGLRQYFVLYLCTTPNAPGMPMVFRGVCAKSLMVAAAERLCRMVAPPQRQYVPIEGIEPRYVPKMPVFEKKP
ncbi:hypothetical protein [Geoalkalibacter sp.]|uniref:hypothetical protein n=1 Tax=Geoalkalibacter sp. TaxID=3041440 RepID=UPI00272DE4C9|nr:hypothetical protein [Geoalkalibacter sp.]